jgi:hypothetical protein
MLPVSTVTRWMMLYYSKLTYIYMHMHMYIQYASSAPLNFRPSYSMIDTVRAAQHCRFLEGRQTCAACVCVCVCMYMYVSVCTSKIRKWVNLRTRTHHCACAVTAGTAAAAAAAALYLPPPSTCAMGGRHVHYDVYYMLQLSL